LITGEKLNEPLNETGNQNVPIF